MMAANAPRCLPRKPALVDGKRWESGVLPGGQVVGRDRRKLQPARKLIDRIIAAGPRRSSGNLEGKQ